MSTYNDRFVTALQDVLGDTFTVSDMGGDLFNVEHTGGMSAPMFGSTRYGRDKRQPVNPDNVLDTVAMLERRMRGNLPHFTPDARLKGERFLTDLPETGA